MTGGSGSGSSITGGGGGGGGGASIPTFNVRRTVLLSRFAATSTKVVSSLTVRDTLPSAATAVPSSVTRVALVVVHATVNVSPFSTGFLLAVNVSI